MPFPPGGAADILARLIGNKVAEQIGQPLVVENRPGAGGTLGADAAAKSPPDGYTILHNTNGAAIAPALYRTLPFDGVKDFAPVTQIVASNLVLVAGPKSGIEFGEGFAGARPRQSGQAQLRLERTRQSAAPDDGDAQARRRRRYRRGAVPRRRAHPHGADRGRNRGGGHPAVRRRAADPGRPPQGAGGHRRRSARSRSRMCRPSPKPRTFRASPPRDGRDGSCPRARPHPSSSESATRSSKAIALPDINERLRGMAYEPMGSTPADFEAYFRAEVVKFTKIIADAKIAKQITKQEDDDAKAVADDRAWRSRSCASLPARTRKAIRTGRSASSCPMRRAAGSASSPRSSAPR